MLYTDSLFLLLFGALCLLGRLLQRWPAVKEWVLITFSFVVIASWGYFGLGLFLAVLFVNYWASIALGRAKPDRARWILTGFIVLDVSTLLAFKYTNFFGENLSALIGLKIPSFPLGIPLAISFYIFHLISYLVDLHARRVRVASVREYLFYLSFFPHVIAGPIVRAWQLVPQIGKTRRVRTDFMIGFHFLVTGFFLKMVVANNIAHTIDPFWAVMDVLGTLESWVVAFLYYCQIYGDFAGYSLMALGMARLLGYRLPANFRSPMRALTMQEFWQRWHITLSRWLRDYLYIPIGGNRVSPIRSAGNVVVTMLLGGLWHGAGWGFVLWGLMHGGLIVIERTLGLNGRNHRWLVRIGWGVFIQLWVTAAWVCFRVPGISQAEDFLGNMLTPTGFDDWVIRPSIAICLLYAVPVVAHNLFPLLIPAISRKQLGLVLGASTAIMLLLNIIIVSPSAVFIYYKF